MHHADQGSVHEAVDCRLEEQFPLVPEQRLSNPLASWGMGRGFKLFAVVGGFAALCASALMWKRSFAGRLPPRLQASVSLDFDAWYVNVQTERARDVCMQKQLGLAHVVPHRYEVDSFGACLDKDTFAVCLKNQGFGDCVQGGIDWAAVSVHGTNEENNLEVASHIISNWCSHKRLFSKLADSAEHVQFFLILEDDAIINDTTMKPAIESFLQTHHSVDWDMVVVDPINSQVDYETHNRLEGGNCDAYTAGHHHGRPIWQIPRADSNASGQRVDARSCLVGNCSFCGAQALLVKKSSLRRIVSIMERIPALPMDWLPRHVPNAIAWKPQVAMNSVGLNRSAPSFCSGNVLVSTIDTDSTVARRSRKLPAVQDSSHVQGKYAFVQLAVDPPGNAPATYVWPVLPMARALQRLGSRYPLVLLTNVSRLPDGTDLAEAMRKLNCYLLPVSRVPLPDSIRQSFRLPRWDAAWLKLQIWGLTQFEKLIWMDSDAIPFRNMDYLFSRNGTWMQRDNWDCTDAFKGNRECSGIMVLQPNADTYAGMIRYASTLAEARFGDQAVISGYFRDVAGTPVSLLDHVDAAFGHCIGRMPGISYRSESSGSLVEGIWGMPAFVHKSSRLNECFGFNATAQSLTINGSMVNICDYNPVGPWWRQVFCEAVHVTGVISSSVSSFCSQFPTAVLV